MYFSPEGIRSRISVNHQAIIRHRNTLGFLEGEHIREKWSCAGLACVVVQAEVLQRPFSLLVLPGPSGRRAVYLGVPSHIDLSELAEFLASAGVHVDSATVELAESVKADRPYRSCWAKGVLILCVVVAVGIVVAVAVAGNRIAGN